MPITITSRYKPLTYDEITRPLIEQTQAQEALENAYMEAQDQAAQLMAQANEQTDHDSYVKLKNYANAIQQQADALMQQGLNRNSRQSLLNLRRRYAQDIVPVANAAKRRQELYDERHKLRLTHPDMLQENEVISLDDLVRNPNMDLGATLYGSDLTKRAATLTNALARGKQSISLGQNLDKYTQTVLSQSGFTPEEIQAALTGNESPESIALRKLYSSTGVDNWKNAAAKQAVWDYITEGAMQGVGEARVSLQKDRVAERNDEIADRNRSEAFSAAMNGYMWDKESKKWVKDPTNPGKNSSSSSMTYKDAAGNIVPMDNAIQDPTSNKVYLVGEDGKLYTANGKNIVAEVPNSEDILRRLENKDLNTFYMTHGNSYIDSFDGAYRVDNKYGINSFTHFIDVFSDSDFLDDKGNFKKDVHVIDNIALPKEGVYSKAQTVHVLKKVRDTKTDNSDWVVVVVDRNWPNDDDYFLIKKDHLSEYKKAAIESRGGTYEGLEFE